MKRIVFIVPENVHLLDLSGPAQVFYEANQMGADYSLVYAAVDRTPQITSSAGIAFGSLQCSWELALTTEDLVVIPGADMKALQAYEWKNSAPFLDWLLTQHKKGVEICSVCTGAYFLGLCGLLNGRKYTTHWKYHGIFNDRFPYGSLVRERFFVTHSNILSSAGISSGIDLALHVLEKHYSSRLAAAVARECVLYLRRGASDPQLSVFMDYRNHMDDRIHTVQTCIAENLDQKLHLQQLAEMAHTSPRNLTRQFKKVTGITIGHYVEKLRVEKAYQLLGNQHPLTYVTHQCGLKSENHLRRLLKKHLDLLPSEILSR